MVDPDLTVTDLQCGNNIRKPIRKLDVKFTSPDYLSCILQQERRNVYNSVRGYSKAHDALDTTFEFFRQLVDINQKDVIRNITLKSKSSDYYFINFQYRSWRSSL